MAAAAALHPTDALEAKLAADIVVAEAYTLDSFRLAGEFRNDLAATIKCRAQANATLRQMRSLLREYRRTQADRATRIRAAGGLPPRLDFAPPEPEIVEALVNGTSPTLRALDQHPAATVAE
jgi:hypothetical protein